MNTISSVLVLIFLLVATVAAWLWGERKAHAARASSTKMLTDTEGRTAALAQQVGSLKEQPSIAQAEQVYSKRPGKSA